MAIVAQELLSSCIPLYRDITAYTVRVALVDRWRCVVALISQEEADLFLRSRRDQFEGTLEGILDFMTSDQYAFLPDDWTRLSEALDVDFVLHIGPVDLRTGKDGLVDLHVCWDAEGEGWCWRKLPGQHAQNSSNDGDDDGPSRCIGMGKSGDKPTMRRKSRLVLKVDIPLSDLIVEDFEEKLRMQFPHFVLKVVDYQDTGGPTWLKNRRSSGAGCRVLLSLAQEHACEVNAFLKGKDRSGPFQDYAMKTTLA